MHISESDSSFGAARFLLKDFVTLPNVVNSVKRHIEVIHSLNKLINIYIGAIHITRHGWGRTGVASAKITKSEQCLTASLVLVSLEQRGPQNHYPVCLHVQGRLQRGTYEQCQSMFEYRGQIGRGPTAADAPFDFHCREWTSVRKGHGSAGANTWAL